jgi:hypothetical protein
MTIIDEFTEECPQEEESLFEENLTETTPRKEPTVDDGPKDEPSIYQVLQDNQGTISPEIEVLDKKITSDYINSIERSHGSAGNLAESFESKELLAQEVAMAKDKELQAAYEKAIAEQALAESKASEEQALAQAKAAEIMANNYKLNLEK